MERKLAQWLKYICLPVKNESYCQIFVGPTRGRFEH